MSEDKISTWALGNRIKTLEGALAKANTQTSLHLEELSKIPALEEHVHDLEAAVYKVTRENHSKGASLIEVKKQLAEANLIQRVRDIGFGISSHQGVLRCICRRLKIDQGQSELLLAKFPSEPGYSVFCVGFTPEAVAQYLTEIGVTE